MRGLLLIVCIVTVDSINVKHGQHASFNPYMVEDADCKATRMQLNQQIKDVKCMPRKTLVQLEPEVGYTYPTDLVLVNRCGGLCFSLSCIPIITTKRPMVVRKYDISSKTQVCGIAFVEEHTKCRCGCNVTEEDCKKNQKYDPDNCSCECTNFEELLACQKRKGMKWNSETCKCMCDKPEEECSTGLQWVPALCRCCTIMPTIDEKK